MKIQQVFLAHRACQAHWLSLCLLLMAGTMGSAKADTRPASTTTLAGLKEEAQVTRDEAGIAHVRAANEHDLYFLQGYVTAEDRLFQMDMLRRLGSGTFAELVGEAGLATDVNLRTIGLRRAAERSLPVIAERTRAALEAYAEGVNAWVATHALPPEYGTLEITQFESWTALDCVTIAKLITFDRSFSYDDETTINLGTYQAAGAAMGFDGTALYFEDLFRSAPFYPATTVGDSSMSDAPRTMNRNRDRLQGKVSQATVDLCRKYFDKTRNLPKFSGVPSRGKRPVSNEWGVSGRHTTSRRALLANDPHLGLDMPSTMYPTHLQAGGRNVIGHCFAGVPFVVLGHNQRISWGAVVNYIDVTDWFLEQLVPDAASPSGLSIVHQGGNEPIIPIPQVFRKNNFDGVLDNVTVVPPGGDIPPVTLVVPRRNNGPLVMLDPANGIAISVQFTGFSATRELDTFEIWNGAKNLNEFVYGLQFFDVGSLNFAYSDVKGNIAFLSGGEVPVREDLQAGVVNGLPPMFLRNGTGGNDWLPVRNPQPGQALPYEILPFSETPQIINPPAGWFVNANNDPVGNTLDNDPFNQLRPGGGIYYLNADFETVRAGRITQLIREKLADGGKISVEDMQAIQADTVLADAPVFVPHILQAWVNAQSSDEPALVAFTTNARLAEAVQRLHGWNFTSPTGIPEGFDASDVSGQRFAPTPSEVAHSVAATLYSVWRGQFIRNTLDAPLVPFGLPTVDDFHAAAALRNLLDQFPTQAGIGASGLNFFNVPGVASAEDRRDIIILKSLADGLDRLAGAPFAPVFANSVNLDDYRWGKLHRLVLKHGLGGPLNIPPAGGAFPPPLPGLDGIPTDGGLGSVDSAIHPVRADDANGFMFEDGPVFRLVTTGGLGPMHGVSSVPGGVSGVLGSPHYADLLPDWLTNEAFPLWTQPSEVRMRASSMERFVPVN